jgi:hypothetical protein
VVLTGIVCGLMGLCAVLAGLVARLHRRQRRAAARIRELRIEAVARGLLPLSRIVAEGRKPAAVADARLVRRKGHLGLYACGRDTTAHGGRTPAARIRLAPGGRAAA